MTGTEIATIITSIGTCSAGIIAALFAGVIGFYVVRMQAKNSEIKALNSRQTSLEEIADEALTSLEVVAVEKSKEIGKPIPKKLAAVVAEHNSPTTKKQEKDAELSTLRARLVAATLQLDLPAREAPPKEPPTDTTNDEIMQKLEQMEKAKSGVQVVQVVQPEGEAVPVEVKEGDIAQAVVDKIEEKEKEGP